LTVDLVTVKWHHLANDNDVCVCVAYSDRRFSVVVDSTDADSKGPAVAVADSMVRHLVNAGDSSNQPSIADQVSSSVCSANVGH